MTPDWLVVVLIIFAFIVGIVTRMQFEAEIRKDGKVIDDALARAWHAGWRSAQGQELTGDHE